ncbi:MAG: beta-propeller fold lactonase family protein [Acidobacteria bacterium]|nr:beta-propeller fold lactonase family protein [Acidobacteriota bacterium]
MSPETHQSGRQINVSTPLFVARASLAAVLFSALCILEACSSTPTRLAYVASGTGIFAYRIDQKSGSVVSIVNSPFLAPTSPTTATSPASVVVHPSNRFLYVSNQDQNTISLFKIDALSGALSEVLPRTAAGISPGPLLLDANGSTLFVANLRSNDISVFSVSASGMLAPISSISLGSSPSSMVAPAAGNLLLVSLPNLSAVEILSVSSGSLTRVPGSPFIMTNSVGSVAVDAQGKFLFVPNPSQNTVSGFAVQPNGSLAVVPGSPFATGVAPVAALVDPTAGFLYVANSGAGTISQYSITSSSGALTALTATAPTVGTNPQFLTLDPSGKFVFVANVGSNSFTELSINSDGSLGSTSNSIQVGSAPRALAFSK